jgi:alkylation response protein AidB-like acyl-CoA dehydrogenase
MTITADEIAVLVAEHLAPRDPGSPGSVLGAGSDDIESGRVWLAAAARHGLGVPTWPREHGGRDADEVEAALIAEVVSGFSVPDLYPYAVGLDLVGPVLIESGTEEQKRRWLPRIADGSEIWCQMFSEPDAGSDMANIATRAERDGDEWVVGGQKVWTSRGPYSKWGMCIARTDPDQVKHKGLTMFAVDMEADGVEVRPLHQMNGDRHFSEVFTADVRVPDSDRLGDEGQGWAMAMTVMAHERASLGGSGGGLDPSGGFAWLHRLGELGRLDDPVWVDRAMALYAEQRAAAWTSARVAHAVGHGGEAGSGGSGGKLRLVNVFKKRTNLLKDALGPAGLLEGEGHVEFLTGPSMSIRGGTDEIQRNIIGERVLGLPPEPRVDKGVSYGELRRQGLA